LFSKLIECVAYASTAADVGDRLHIAPIASSDAASPCAAEKHRTLSRLDLTTNSMGRSALPTGATIQAYFDRNGRPISIGMGG